MITYNKYFYRWPKLMENLNITFNSDFEIYDGFLYFLARNWYF